MPEQNIALELADVEFRRRGRVILTKVNLKINKGEKWVLFGPNGIGKSSLVQMMSTRGFPSEGTVDILGNRLGKVDVFSYRNRIGLSSAELSRAFPPQEDPLDAIVTALTGDHRPLARHLHRRRLCQGALPDVRIRHRIPRRQDDVQAFGRRTYARADLPCADGRSGFADFGRADYRS